MSIKINRVYTRSGDDGSTGLVGGRRVSKSDDRVEAFGEVDELNSVLGIVRELCQGATSQLRTTIENLQQQLFDLGSELATPAESHYSGMWQASSSHIQELEHLCDKFGENLPELTSFILPGGSLLAANLHLARCVARRAERRLVSLSQTEKSLNKQCIIFMNRLSDLLFIMARYALNLENCSTPLWVQEKDRGKF